MALRALACSLCLLASCTYAQDYDAVVPEGVYTSIPRLQTRDRAQEEIKRLNTLVTPEKKIKTKLVDSAIVKPKSIDSAVVANYVDDLRQNAPLQRFRAKQTEKLNELDDEQMTRAVNKMNQKIAPAAKKVVQKAAAPVVKKAAVATVAAPKPQLSSVQVERYLHKLRKHTASKVQLADTLEKDEHEAQAAQAAIVSLRNHLDPEADTVIVKGRSQVKLSQENILSHLHKYSRQFGNRMSKAVELALPMTHKATAERAADWLSTAVQLASFNFKTKVAHLKKVAVARYGKDFGEFVVSSAADIKSKLESVNRPSIHQVYSMQKDATRKPVAAVSVQQKQAVNIDLLTSILGVPVHQAEIMLAKYRGNIEHVLDNIQV